MKADVSVSADIGLLETLLKVIWEDEEVPAERKEGCN